MSADVPSRPGGRPIETLEAVVSTTNERSREGTFVERTLLWAFIAGLAWVPFLFGSNVLLAWGINAVLFPGLVAIYELSLLIGRGHHAVAIKQIKAPAVLFAAVVLWILIQNATWTPDWLHHPIWQMSADELGRPIEGSISVDRDLTSLALLRLVTSASVFWISLQLCRDASRANLLLKSVAVLSCAYAAYGLFAFALTPGRVLWLKTKFPTNGFVMSSFINPNSFATYAGMGIVVLCGLILRVYRDEFIAVGGSVRFKIATFIEVTGKKGVVLFACVFVTLVALLLTRSRGGILSTMCGLMVLGVLTLKSRKLGLGAGIIIVVGVLLGGIVFYVFGNIVVSKFTLQGFGDTTRMAVYMITMRSILDAPLLGFGYGTFADVFPMFRDRSLSTFFSYDHAHNSYLEVFQGLGLPFGSMLLASIALLALRCARGAITRRKNEMIPCVAAGVACLLAVHSLVDFSLQIEAVAVTFMALLGAGVAQSKSSRLMLGD